MRTSSLRRSRSSTERNNFGRYRRLIDSHKNSMQLFSEIVDLRAKKGEMGVLREGEKEMSASSRSFQSVASLSSLLPSLQKTSTKTYSILENKKNVFKCSDEM